MLNGFETVPFMDPKAPDDFHACRAFLLIAPGRIRYFKQKAGQLVEKKGNDNPFDNITFSALASNTKRYTQQISSLMYTSAQV